MSWLVFPYKNVNKIENQLNEEFCNICDWFVDNKLSEVKVRLRQNQYFLLLNLKGRI